MGQYQITTVLRDEEELERFAFGQRLARDEERRIAWERHYREAKGELEKLQAEIERLKEEKAALENTLQSLKSKGLEREKLEFNGVYEEHYIPPQ